MKHTTICKRARQFVNKISPAVCALLFLGVPAISVSDVTTAWSERHFLSDYPGTGGHIGTAETDYQPAITGNSTGRAVAVWLRGGAESLYSAVSTDSGATFGPMTSLNSTSTGYLALKLGENGTCVLFYRQGTTLKAMRSADGGATFSPSVTIGVSVYTPMYESDVNDLRIDTDDNGRWIVAWQEQSSVDFDLMSSASTDDGQTWSTPAPINPNAASDQETTTTSFPTAFIIRDVDAVNDFNPTFMFGVGDEVTALYSTFHYTEHEELYPHAPEDNVYDYQKEPSRLVAVQSSNSGATWAEAYTPTVAGSPINSINASIQKLGSGVWAMLYNGDSGSDSPPTFATSIDGREWTAQSTLLDHYEAWLLRIDDEWLVAATRYGPPQCSQDGGDTWSHVADAPFLTAPKSDRPAFGVAGDNLLIAVSGPGNPGGSWYENDIVVHRAGNCAVTSTGRVPDNDKTISGNDGLNAIGSDNSGNVVCMWDSASLGVRFSQLSTDFGKTWSERVPVPSHDNIKEIRRLDTGTWIATGRYLHVSNDGLNWVKTDHYVGEWDASTFIAQDGTMAQFNEAKQVRFSYLGEGWSEYATTTMHPTNSASGFYTDGKGRYLFTITDGAKRLKVIYSDNLELWSAPSLLSSVGYEHVSVATDRHHNWMIVANYGLFYSHVYRSTDNGVTWAHVYGGDWITLLGVVTDNCGSWFIPFSRQISTDLGATWNVIPPPVLEEGETIPVAGAYHFTMVGPGRFSLFTRQPSEPNGNELYTRSGTLSSTEYQPLDQSSFNGSEEQAGGSPSGWSNLQSEIAGVVQMDHDTTHGAYRVRVYQNTLARLGGWTNNRLEWLPYALVGTQNYVRSKFYVYAQPPDGQASFVNPRHVPNFAMRLANRFVITANLEVFSHNQFDPANDALANELRPSSDPDNPSIYRVDFDPVDVPFLSTSTSGEGIMRGFEVIALEPQEQGYVGMTESSIGVYPAALLSDESAVAAKIFAPDGSGAGNLRIYNSATDLTLWSMVGGNVDTAEPQFTYSEGVAGVTFDSSLVPTDRLGIADRNFFAGSADGAAANGSRIRIGENQQYKVRWHVTSMQPTSTQGWLWLQGRALKFAYSQKLMLAGGASSNATNSRTLAHQAIPGVGSLNPDRISNENGGWYTMLVNSPMHPEIRPEFPEGTAVGTRLPLIAGQPGYGVDSPSARDVKLSARALDTISIGTGAQDEVANFTIDRIELRAFPAVED